MKAYHFDTVVESDSSVRISGLPPERKVEVVVLERTEISKEMQDWLDDISSRHPFTKMSKDEVLAILRKTREEVWAE